MVRLFSPLAVFLYLCLPVCAQKPFNSHADSLKDFEKAKQLAKVEHRQILLDFGANWCPGCIVLDHYFQTNADVKSQLKNFVVVHAATAGTFFTDRKTTVLSRQFPAFSSIPEIMILDADGKLLRQGNSDAFFDTSDPKHALFSPQKTLAFLNESQRAPGK